MSNFLPGDDVKLDLKEIMKDSIRQYFAPLTGAWKAI